MLKHFCPSALMPQQSCFFPPLPWLLFQCVLQDHPPLSAIKYQSSWRIFPKALYSFFSLRSLPPDALIHAQSFNYLPYADDSPKHIICSPLFSSEFQAVRLICLSDTSNLMSQRQCNLPLPLTQTKQSNRDFPSALVSVGRQHH